MYKEQYEIADQEYVLDISKAQDILDWKPKYSDADMILEAYIQYRQRK